MKCPQCDGEGKVLGLFAIRSDGGPCDPARMFPCPRCRGAGTVPDEMARWIEDGARMRDERRSRGVGVWWEARMRGISPADLAAMENGLIAPRPAERHAPEPPDASGASDAAALRRDLALVAIANFDAGPLACGGGGDVAWWHNYIGMLLRQVRDIAENALERADDQAEAR